MSCGEALGRVAGADGKRGASLGSSADEWHDGGWAAVRVHAVPFPGPCRTLAPPSPHPPLGLGGGVVRGRAAARRRALGSSRPPPLLQREPSTQSVIHAPRPRPSSTPRLAPAPTRRPSHRRRRAATSGGLPFPSRLPRASSPWVSPAAGQHRHPRARALLSARHVIALCCVVVGGPR